MKILLTLMPMEGRGKFRSSQQNSVAAFFKTTEADGDLF